MHSKHRIWTNGFPLPHFRYEKCGREKYQHSYDLKFFISAMQNVEEGSHNLYMTYTLGFPLPHFCYAECERRKPPHPYDLNVWLFASALLLCGMRKEEASTFLCVNHLAFCFCTFSIQNVEGGILNIIWLKHLYFYFHTSSMRNAKGGSLNSTWLTHSAFCFRTSAMHNVEGEILNHYTT